MKRYDHILVPYDGSNISGEALETAKVMAEHQVGKLTVLYVHDESAASSMCPDIATSGDADLLQSQTNVEAAPLPMESEKVWTEEMSEQEEKDIPGSIIAKAKGMIPETLKVQFKIKNGNPAKEILKFAEDHHVDFIVMGSRGLSGIRKYTMGSVSHKVTNQSNCSVMIVR